MTSGGWHSQEQRHGRHRQGTTGEAWTPVVRPTDTGPAHARMDGRQPVSRPVESAPAWPTSEVLTRRPGWPTVDAEARPTAPAPPKRKTVSADMVLDTVPMGRVRDKAVVHALPPETPPSGLRKFELGNVPASVTPPRSWRKAALFAVGTSAAVVLGLTVAAAELMGRTVDDDTIIDALPSYPTGPLTLDQLPNQQTTTDSPDSPTSSRRSTTPVAADVPAADQQQVQEEPRDTMVGGTTDGQTTTDPSIEDTTSTTPTAPNRRTVGPAPVTPTDPQTMGDRTEQYFALVTTNAAAAHTLTTGGMAREGAEGIEARYVGVERVEVQDITIDRNQAITTSTIKVVHEDGTVTIETRRLTFTWGGDPKITEDSTTA
jgi:hypothetical protein